MGLLPRSTTSIKAPWCQGLWHHSATLQAHVASVTRRGERSVFASLVYAARGWALSELTRRAESSTAGSMKYRVYKTADSMKHRVFKKAGSMKHRVYKKAGSMKHRESIRKLKHKTRAPTTPDTPHTAGIVAPPGADCRLALDDERRLVVELALQLATRAAASRRPGTA